MLVTDHFPVRDLIFVSYLSNKERGMWIVLCTTSPCSCCITVSITIATAICTCVVHADINTGNATALRSLIRIFYRLYMKTSKLLKYFAINTAGMPNPVFMQIDSFCASVQPKSDAPAIWENRFAIASISSVVSFVMASGCTFLSVFLYKSMKLNVHLLT